MTRRTKGTKPRKYKLRRNADRRLAELQAMWPQRKFWVAPTQDFKFAVFTERQAPAGDPNAIGAICA